MTRTSRVIRFEAAGGQWAQPDTLTDITADDALLDTIAAGGQPAGRLERLLVAWRRRAIATPR